MWLAWHAWKVEAEGSKSEGLRKGYMSRNVDQRVYASYFPPLLLRVLRPCRASKVVLGNEGLLLPSIFLPQSLVFYETELDFLTFSCSAVSTTKRRVLMKS
jgi:hypothetical protein